MEYYELTEIHVVFNNIIFYDDGSIGNINNNNNKIPTRLDFKQMRELQPYRPDLPFYTLFLYQKREAQEKKKDEHPLLKYNKNLVLDNWFKVTRVS